MYDTPAEVAEAFLSSLTETIEGVDAEDGHSPGLKAERGGGAGGWAWGGEGAGDLFVVEPEPLWWHPGEQQKRKIILDPSGSMNIYLVLDGSDSVGANNFTGAKNCLRAFIEKVGTLKGPHCPAKTSSQILPASQSHRVPENLQVLLCPLFLLPVL